jgi:outer membrane protein assembly factor BamB
VVANNRVVIAEQNTNRVSERDTANGKEIWGETFNQPINLHRLSNGNLLIVGRHQVVEWDRARKPVVTITRPQHDIVAGAKLRNGNFCVYTQQGYIVTYDKSGKQIDTFAAGRGNYNSTMQVLPSGKLVITQFRGIAEVDLNAKKAELIMNYNFPTSAQKLPNGNILVSNQNNYQVAEMDPKANNKIAWDYKPENNNNNFYRAWRAKRR